MVAQHYRWDFIGLSTDSKPTAENPKVTNGSTYYDSDTSKLYVWYNNQWYEKTATGGYELPIASTSTLGGVKVGEGLSIDAGGVLSASGGGGGEAGAFHVLTSADYNYPADNPSAVALWLLPNGIYYVDNTASIQTEIKVNNSDTSLKSYVSLFMIYDYPQDQDGTKAILCFGNAFQGDSSGSFALREYITLKSDGTDWGGYIFNTTSL